MKTLEEIERSGKNMLLPADVADYLGCDPQSIRLQARTDASALGFPVVVIGNRFCRAMNVEGQA